MASTFFVLDKIELVEPPKQLNGCNLTLDGCSVTFEFHFDATVSYYYCANPDVPATEAGCPRDDTFFLTTQTKKGLKEQRSRRSRRRSWKTATMSAGGSCSGEERSCRSVWPMSSAPPAR
ncbi:hypothetical protein GCM10009601_36360 [Streptomyces thermospinosisporus]|uniref:Uncharacterized protein n=1 Tax=Streptomyces thermospinosisporus TaxID=161482 RepID=A0ABP4JS37_9ACTN